MPWERVKNTKNQIFIGVALQRVTPIKQLCVQAAIDSICLWEVVWNDGCWLCVYNSPALCFPGTFLPCCGVKAGTSKRRCTVNLAGWARRTPVESGSIYPCRTGPQQPLTSLSPWGSIWQEVMHFIRLWAFLHYDLFKLIIRRQDKRIASLILSTILICSKGRQYQSMSWTNHSPGGNGK